MVVTHMSRVEPRCHTHGFSVPCPPSIPFSKVRRKERRAEGAGPPKVSIWEEVGWDPLSTQ